MSDNWIDVIAVDAVPVADVTAVTVNGHDIALYEVEGEIHATANVCTHGAARMSDGFLEGREIECPLHQGKFDVCTGKALCAPNRPRNLKNQAAPWLSARLCPWALHCPVLKMQASQVFTVFVQATP